MEVQGWVVVALALVMFGYLVPYLVRSRQQLADSRVDDRFSGAMRVVVTGTTPKRTTGEHHTPARPYLHDPRRRTENPAVNRPMSPTERSAADARRLAALRAARAAEISRRQAAARRRLILTLVLLTASIGGWTAVGASGASIALGLVPTVLLGAVLVLGRRAAKAAARRNAADRAAMARLQLTPAARSAGTRAVAGSRTHSPQVTAAGPAVTAADDATTADDATPEAGPTPSADDTTTDATATSTAATEPATSRSWTPVPVPVPSYTLKAPAPRRDVAAHVPEEVAIAAPEAGSVRDLSLADIEGSPYAPVARSAQSPEQPAVEESTTQAPAGGLDLDSVLARRRAVGA